MRQPPGAAVFFLSLTHRFRYHLRHPAFFYVRPRHVWVMGEERQPFLRDGSRVVALFALDGLDGEEIERHAPGEIDVRGGWDQAGYVTGGFAAAFDHDGLHEFGMPRKYLHGDSGDDLLG